jgi:ParB family chromosome partitioning protein
MNARNNTAATLEIAVPAQNLILVPLSQLRPSRRNVRKTVGASVTELAASIARVGLLQNLTVILASDGEHYEVVAGGRRLAALKLLAKKKRVARDYDVPCLLVADASARTASLTENVQREAMIGYVSILSCMFSVISTTWQDLAQRITICAFT